MQTSRQFHWSIILALICTICFWYYFVTPSFSQGSIVQLRVLPSTKQLASNEMFYANKSAIQIEILKKLQEIATTSNSEYLQTYRLNEILWQDTSLNLNATFFSPVAMTVSQVSESFRQYSGLEKIDMTPKYNKLDPSRLIFVIMASSRNKQRLRNMRRTYMQWPSNYFIFSDEADDEIGARTLPEIEGDPSYKGAQFRQLHGMKYIYNNQSELLAQSDWIIFGDDDSWFNVPAIMHFLSQYSPQLPISFGYLWLNVWQPGSVYGGGAGIVFSRTSFSMTAQAVLTPLCPFDELNDITVSRCFTKIGVLRVHEPRFHHAAAGNAIAKRPLLNDVASQFSFHYMTNPRLLRDITCFAAKAWKTKLPALHCGNFWDFRS